MGMRGVFHEARVAELVKKFPVWRAERLPGSRAFQSTYDRFAPSLVHMPDEHFHLPKCFGRVGTTVCRWLYQTVHDTSAISVFDYVLPLMVSYLTLLFFPLRPTSYPISARTFPLHRRFVPRPFLLALHLLTEVCSSE